MSFSLRCSSFSRRIPNTTRGCPFTPWCTHRSRGQSEYGVSIEVQWPTNKVVIMGVRKDAEAAAEKIRGISHEFRTTEERLLVEPYQVCPLVD